MSPNPLIFVLGGFRLWGTRWRYYFLAKIFVKKLGGYKFFKKFVSKIQFILNSNFFINREWAHSIPRQKLPQGV
jgi:hypothetical protein